MAPLHGKPYFLFPDVLKRCSVLKNCAGMWSFLYYWERWHFFFPKIWSYTLDGKWKIIFFKKYMEIWYFLQTFWKDGLFKKGRARTSLHYLERWYFFTEKIFFSSGRKWEMTFLKKYMEIWYFLCTGTGVRNVVSRPSAKKIKDGLVPQKAT